MRSVGNFMLLQGSAMLLQWRLLVQIPCYKFWPMSKEIIIGNLNNYHDSSKCFVKVASLL